MMINRAAISSHGEAQVRFRLSPADARRTPASPLSSGGAPESSIALEPEVAVALGSINGKPIEMRILPEGGYEWTGKPRDRAAWADDISVEEILVARAARSFTREEFDAVTRMLGVLHGLYLWTIDVWSIGLLNAYVAEFASAAAARDGVRRLGLDPDAPFVINGRAIRLLGDRFVPWVAEP